MYSSVKYNAIVISCHINIKIHTKVLTVTKTNRESLFAGHKYIYIYKLLRSFLKNTPVIMYSYNFSHI